MMEVDQPAVSQVDKDADEAEKSEPAATSVTSPDIRIQESDELPALVISDSEGDESPAAANPKATEGVKISKNQVADISGVAPLQESVLNMDTIHVGMGEKDDGETVSLEDEANARKSIEEDPGETKQKQQPCKIYENIDLTGTSSADDSGVSDQGCETDVVSKNVKKPKESVVKVVKDTSSLTAQELLQSLLGIQQEDSVDSENAIDEASAVECSDMIKFNDESSKEQNNEMRSEPENVSATAQSDQGENYRAQVDEVDTDGGVAEDTTKGLVSSSLNANNNAVDSVPADVDPTNSIEISQEKQDTDKIPPGETPVACNGQLTGDTADSNDTDDDVCLLEEEVEDPFAVVNNVQPEKLNGTALGNTDSAGSMIEVPVGKDNECRPQVSAESKDLEEDIIEEPPNKRARSSSQGPGALHETLEVLQCPEMQNIALEKSLNDSNDNLRCENADKKDNSSEIIEKESITEGTTKIVTSSRSSDVEDSVKVVEPGNKKVTHVESIAKDSSEKLSAVEVHEINVQRSEPIEGKVTSPLLCPEVLIIDDDDDDDLVCLSASEKIDNTIPSTSSASTGKRPSDNDLSVTVKRSKLEELVPSTTGSEEAKPKKCDVSSVKPLAMEFMKKFAKPLSNITRDDLEELVLQKICEAMIFKSELAEERKQAEHLMKQVQSLRKRVLDVTKQYSDLKVVHDRAVLDLIRKAQRFVTPVRITRAVGLQVNIPPQFSFHAFRANAPIITSGGGGGGESRATELSIVPTSAATENTETPEPQGNTGSLASKNVVQQQQHNMPPNVIRTSVPINVTFAHNSSASAVTIKPAGSVRPCNGTATEMVSVTNSNASPAGTPRSYKAATTSTSSPDKGNKASNDSTSSSSSGSVTARKKTLHKITPKRPGLSAVEQLQQEHMALRQQEQIVQDMHTVQARMARAAANGSKGGSTAAALVQTVPGVGSKVPSRTTTITQSTRVNATVSTNARTLHNNNRVDLANATITAPKQTVSHATAPSLPSCRTASAAVDSLIDLTDEEESPRVGIVAPARNRQGPNGTTDQRQQMPMVGLALPPENKVANQLMRLSQVVRHPSAKPKPVGQFRLVNGHGSQSAGASNNASPKFGTVQANTVRPVMSRRPVGNSAAAAGLAATLNEGSRYHGSPQDHPTAAQIQQTQAAHPPLLAPLPQPGRQFSNPDWKKSPPQPAIRINNLPAGIIISWAMPDLSELHADIDIYQIYAFQEPADHSSSEGWRHVGDVKALPLPMAVTLTHFHEGQRYHFAVRAIDTHKRVGHFSEARTWNEVNPSQQIAN